tara:strand:- start:1077 stop:1706 length:630 start_codon:yes stop_codon:yes gene_type:complete
MKKVSVLDYGMGNIGSILNMLKKIGVESNITSSKLQLQESDYLIIPGIGHFDNAIKKIKKLNIFDALNELALDKKIPILGICLGMQLMTLGSEEGKEKGFGWVNANVLKIDGTKKGIRVPHMGWNKVNIEKKNNLFDIANLPNQRFYFVHSYAVYCDNKEDILTTTNYENTFVSSFHSDNLTGVQFHPEKSHKYGESFFRSYFNEIQVS